MMISIVIIIIVISLTTTNRSLRHEIGNTDEPAQCALCGRDTNLGLCGYGVIFWANKKRGLKEMEITAVLLGNQKGLGGGNM